MAWANRRAGEVRVPSRWLRHMALIVALGVAIWLVDAAGHAAEATGGIDLGALLVGLLGGLAVFLFGMEQMGDALQAFAGGGLRRLLARLTRNRLAGLLTGFAVASVVQSSGTTTSMLVGLITIGLMSLGQALSVILGAGIGGTVTPQLAAFNIYGYALLFVAVGFAMWSVSRDQRTRQLGRLVLSFGLLFYGLKLMTDAMAPLREYEPFLELLASLRETWLAVAVATVFTALVQSSAATVGVVVVFAQQGLIDLETGIGLVLGANLGTCATALLASLGKSREAKRAAAALVTFKLIGIVLVLPLLGPFADLVRLASPELVERQVANAHTLWNVAIALLFLPFTQHFERLLHWLMPDLPEAEDANLKPRYLDRSMLDSPALAMGLVRREVGRVCNRLETMLDLIPAAVFEIDLDRAAELPPLDDQVDALYQAIAAYLTDVGQTTLSAEQADEVLAAITAVAEFECIGDVMETNLVEAAHSLADETDLLSAEAKGWLTAYHDLIRRAFRSTMIAFVSNEPAAAQVVLDMKSEITDLDARIRAWQLDELRQVDGRPPMSAYAVEMDILENLRRIYYHSKRVAKLVVRAEGAAAWTSASAG